MLADPAARGYTHCSGACSRIRLHVVIRTALEHAHGSGRTALEHKTKSLTFFPFGRHCVTSDLYSAHLTYVCAFMGDPCGTKWTAHGYKYIIYIYNIPEQCTSQLVYEARFARNKMVIHPLPLSPSFCVSAE